MQILSQCSQVCETQGSKNLLFYQIINVIGPELMIGCMQVHYTDSLILHKQKAKARTFV